MLAATKRQAGPLPSPRLPAALTERSAGHPHTRRWIMSIVAISPTLGRLGDEFGREVARARGYEFADREIIEKASARFGEGVMELAHATEEKPTLWERFVDTSRRYMTYVEAIVLEMAARDNVVLAGRGAAFLLGTTR